MAEEQKKSQDEEIIDLTEVIEEGDPELAKFSQDSDDDFDDDLKDFFDSLSSDQEDDEGGQDNELDKEFENLFREHNEQEAQPQEKTGKEQFETDDFLEELMQENGKASEENTYKPESRVEEPGLDDLFGDEDFDQAREKKTEYADKPLSEQEHSIQGDKLQEGEDKPETDFEPELEAGVEEPLQDQPGAEPQESAQKLQTEAEYEPEAPPARGTSDFGKSAPGGVEHLAQQMENMEERMEKLRGQVNSVEEEFAGRVLQTLEEKGSQLGFIQEMIPGIVNQAVEKTGEKIQEKLGALRENEFQDILSRLSLLEKKVAEMHIPDTQELQDKLEQKIDEKIQSALEHQKDGPGKDLDSEGLKQELHQELENKIHESVSGITDSSVQKTTEHLQQEMDSLRQNELQDLNSRMKSLEEQSGNTDTPDIQSLRDELEQKINQTLESAESPQEEPPDLSGLKEEVIQSVESRIQELVSTCQSEKRSLATELENALTFRGRMQEKLNELSQDIVDLKDRGKKPDHELQETIDSLYQSSVSREDLRHLASQLRYELEEHVQKQVPEAAAKVIRDEIMAMLQEDQEQE